MERGVLAISATSISAQPHPRIEPASHGISVRARVLTMLLLVGMLVSLVVAVPALRSVARAIAHVDPDWLVLAGAFELASCASFVVVFRHFFARVPTASGRSAQL